MGYAISFKFIYKLDGSLRVDFRNICIMPFSSAACARESSPTAQAIRPRDARKVPPKCRKQVSRLGSRNVPHTNLEGACSAYVEHTKPDSLHHEARSS